MPPATRETAAAESEAGAGGVLKANPQTPSVSSGRAYFGGINGSSSNSSSDDSRTSSDSSNNNDRGDLPAFVGRPARDLEVFGELPELQRVFQRLGGRGYGDSVPGEVTKTIPSGGRTKGSPTWSVSLPRIQLISPGGW